MKNLLKPVVILLVLLLTSTLTQAQVGREFWFVAPEATSSHGDKPIFFRITTFNEGTNLTIEFPANTNFTPINVYVPANTQYTTAQDAFELDDIENRPSNTILNKGIRITAHDADVSAYYEIAHTGNPDKFTLKGLNALGTEFFIPSQNSFRNNNRTPIADEKVDIVATEDDTEVIIVPTVDVVGHNKGDTIRVTLNQGQTFSVENLDISKTSSMAGTYVESNKLIAITISDDSIHNNDGGSAHDMIGDQLIPVNVIGTEYVIVNTSTDNVPGNHGTTLREVYITATEDGTVIYKNGSATIERSLNRGESTQMTITEDNMYLEANRPIYVYQLASLRFDGDGNEIGSSLLPHANCTGSDIVTVKRIFDNEFFLQLMVKGKDRASFTIRDEGGTSLDYLDNVDWKMVLGTDGSGTSDAWYTANIQLSDRLSSDGGKVYFIQNTGGLFHLSILEENRSSVSYGYFSSFSNLNVNGLTEGCQGDHILLNTLEPMRSYEWYSDVSGGNTILSNTRECEARETGTYWVKAEVMFGGCVLTDSIDVEFIQPEIDLGGDTLVCPGEVLTFGSDDVTNVYDWSNGTNNNYTDVTVTDGYSGTLSVTITDTEGCSNADTVAIGSFSVPTINLDAVSVCEGGRITNLSSFARYEWSLNGVILNADPTQNYIDPVSSGNYVLTAYTENDCSITENFVVTVSPLPTFTITDQSSCEGETHRIDGPTGATYAYTWSTGSNAAFIDVVTPGDYWLEVEDANGCEFRQDFSFRQHISLPIDLGDDRNECAGTQVVITNDIDNLQTYANYQWFFDDGVTSQVALPSPSPDPSLLTLTGAATESGIYTVIAEDANGCEVSDDVEIIFFTTDPPPISLDKDLCSGKSITIYSSPGYNNYSWTLNGTPIPGTNGLSSIINNQAGTYTLTAEDNGCVKEVEIEVALHESPTVDLPDNFSFCPGTDSTIYITNYTPAVTGGDFAYLYWNGQRNNRYYDWTTDGLSVNQARWYTVNVVDEFGCSDFDNVQVTEHPETTLTLVDPTPVCENDGFELQNPITDATSYTWFKEEAAGDVHLVDDANHTVFQTGTYRLDILDVNGCAASDELVLIANPVPSVDLGNDLAICQFETLEVQVDNDYAQYRWNDDPALNTKSISVNTSGTYKLEVANDHGCWAEDQIDVTVSSAPVFSLGRPGPECPGHLFTLSGPAGMAEYQWSSLENTQTVQKYNGTYSLKVKDLNGCEFADTVTLSNHLIPSVNLGPDTTICPLYGDFELDAGPGFASYAWSTNDNTQTTIADIFEAINTVTVTSAEGCIDGDDVLVIHMEPPVLEILDDEAVCDLDSIQLDASGDDLIEWEWSNGSTDPYPWVKEAGEYILRANDGCVWMADTMELVVHETPVVSRIDTTIYAQVVIYPLGGTEPYMYAINDEAYQNENVFKNLENGDHTFWVEDDNGCITSELVSLYDVLDIEIPNFFTPNGDGYNDTWNLSGFDRVPDSIIKIYDRYGKLLKKYKVSDPAWDGTYLGKHLRTDDYWYVIELIPIDKILKGHLTLKR